MKVSIRDRLGKTLDEMLSPDDNLILRCVDCQEFFLPRELHTLKRRVNDRGTWTWEVHELCPACNPNPDEFRKDAIVQSSTFVYLTRYQYDTTKAYERAGLLPPDFEMKESLIKVVSN